MLEQESLSLILSFVLFMVVLYLKYKLDRERFKERLTELFVVAERLLQQQILKNEDEMLEWVTENGFQYMPKLFEPFFTYEKYFRLIREIYENIKQHER